jgi:chromosome segregation ATPase
MDSSLSQEIKRRIEGSQNLQDECNRQVEEMEKKLMNIMTNKIQLVTDRLGELEVKVEELNERLNEERTKIPADLEKKGKELKDMLQSFQSEFSVERRDRLTREGRIMKQLTDQANDMSNQWKKEISEREETVAKLGKQLTNHESNRAEADREFETLIERELKALREDVERETNERQIEDDEIVEALNRYTDNLQSSLLGNDD